MSVVDLRGKSDASTLRGPIPKTQPAGWELVHRSSASFFYSSWAWHMTAAIEVCGREECRLH